MLPSLGRKFRQRQADPAGELTAAAMPASPWGLMGEDLFDALFPHLERDDKVLAKARLVNRHWRQLVDASISEIEPRQRITEPNLSQLLRRFNGLTAVNVGEPWRLRLTDESIPALLGLTRLQALDVTPLLSNEGLLRLGPLAGKLTALQYAGHAAGRSGGLSDSGAQFIGQAFTALQALDISRCPQLGAGIAGLSALTALRSLRLFEISRLKDAALLQALPPLCRLTKLTVSQSGVGDAGLAAMGALTGLRELDLSNNWALTDEGLAAFSSLRSLEWLNLTGSNQVSMSEFPPLLRLTRLELGATDVNYAGLVAIGALSSLQRLSLTDCQGVATEGLHALSTLGKLQSINLRSCMELTEPQSLQPLTSLTALTRLMLGYIEDLPVESLLDLAPMTQLQHLELSGAIPASALAAIVKPFRRLSELLVPDTPLSPPEVADLRRQMPCLDDIVHQKAGQYEEMIAQMDLPGEDDGQVDWQM